ncbi:hypothetical protein TREES_T100015879 [Tupaia chinensis]|uniref:Uncharacterized protein n=1 Tax=Tupaia chinensis TaxID=246437 RepID=L9L632_TUPCH|nr:hypothetical protein TREES_T100015879 [Tupaia chinensis]
MTSHVHVILQDEHDSRSEQAERNCDGVTGPQFFTSCLQSALSGGDSGPGGLTYSRVFICLQSALSGGDSGPGGLTQSRALTCLQSTLSGGDSGPAGLTRSRAFICLQSALSGGDSGPGGLTQSRALICLQSTLSGGDSGPGGLTRSQALICLQSTMSGGDSGPGGPTRSQAFMATEHSEWVGKVAPACLQPYNYSSHSPSDYDLSEACGLMPGTRDSPRITTVNAIYSHLRHSRKRVNTRSFGAGFPSLDQKTLSGLPWGPFGLSDMVVTRILDRSNNSEVPLHGFDWICGTELFKKGT